MDTRRGHTFSSKPWWSAGSSPWCLHDLPKSCASSQFAGQFEQGNAIAQIQSVPQDGHGAFVLEASEDATDCISRQTEIISNVRAGHRYLNEPTIGLFRAAVHLQEEGCDLFRPR